MATWPTDRWRITATTLPMGCSMGSFSLWLWGYVRGLSLQCLPKNYPYGGKSIVYFLRCHFFRSLYRFSALCFVLRSEILSSKGERLLIVKIIRYFQRKEYKVDFFLLEIIELCLVIIISSRKFVEEKQNKVYHMRRCLLALNHWSLDSNKKIRNKYDINKNNFLYLRREANTCFS